MLQLLQGNAICYCGYRHGQSPDSRCYPTLEQIREDLHILRKYWQLLRLYDGSMHAERVLQLIEEHPKASQSENAAELQRLVALAQRYPDIVFSVAVGNEATVDWTRQAGLPCFVFEAFDEPWKGSSDPLEPEKHLGLFTVDRRQALVMRELYPELALPEPA